MPQRGSKDGKGVGGHDAYVKDMLAKAQQVIGLQQALEDMEDDELYVHQLKFASRGSDAWEWLVVLTVDSKDGAKVAFSSAGTLSEAIGALLGRIQNNSLRWKDDEFRNKRSTDKE